MSFFPRLRQACRGHPRGPANAASAGAQMGQGQSGGANALCGHPPTEGVTGAPRGPDPRLEVNRLFLTGVLIADPQQDAGRNGNPVTLLLVAFPAPDTPESRPGPEAASCEVEVPEQVAEPRHRELRAGVAIFITGQLSGGGGIIATEIYSGPPPGATLE